MRVPVKCIFDFSGNDSCSFLGIDIARRICDNVANGAFVTTIAIRPMYVYIYTYTFYKLGPTTNYDFSSAARYVMI